MEARTRIFSHLVTRGLDRAYRAAAMVEADHPGSEVEVNIRYPERLDEPDLDKMPDVFFLARLPELPDVEFIAANFGETTATMSRRIELVIGKALVSWNATPSTE